MYASFQLPNLWLLVALFFAAAPVLAAVNLTSKNNVAIYYGQGPNQKRLSTYCSDRNVDVIILSFVHLFPQQANGYPGINFGNQCNAQTYPGPGYKGKKISANNKLQICPNLQSDLNACRKTSTKKILLSLGGATSEYQLNGATDGTNFATLLWGMFGPRQAAWVNKGYPRPLDYNDIGFSVDGFDLDIEHPPTDKSAGYRALVTKLRSLYANASGTFYLSASPQCIVPDANMKDILTATKFDLLFIQFYNTYQCSARAWAKANPSYKPGGTFKTAGFTYANWTTWLSKTSSRNARLYITLPGSGAAAAPGYNLTVTEASNLANAYYCQANFGGVAVWDATYAASNVANKRNFYQNMKAALTAAGSDLRQSCVKKSRRTLQG